MIYGQVIKKDGACCQYKDYLQSYLMLVELTVVFVA
jgi:hypothetical protein